MLLAGMYERSDGKDKMGSDHGDDAAWDLSRSPNEKRPYLGHGRVFSIDCFLVGLRCSDT